LGVGRGDLLLARQPGAADKPVFDPVLKVTIPDEGKRFILALFASPAASPAKPDEFRRPPLRNQAPGAGPIVPPGTKRAE
jgi:hypothetical protein